jgi:hypothetical protein
MLRSLQPAAVDGLSIVAELYELVGDAHAALPCAPPLCSPLG